MLSGLQLKNKITVPNNPLRYLELDLFLQK